MGIDNRKLFEKVSVELKKNLENSFINNSVLISDFILRLEIIAEFEEIFKKNDSVKILHEVSYDLFTSIYFSINGIYRSGFASMRSAAELILGFFYFTDYNFHYEKWKIKQFDLSWSSLTEANNGILSKSYLCLFFQNYSQYENIIKDYRDLYHYCSEFLHGKYDFMHTLNDPKIVYDEEMINDFGEKFKHLTNLFFSIIILRFNNSLLDLKEPNYIYIHDVCKKYNLNTLMPEYGK